MQTLPDTQSSQAGHDASDGAPGSTYHPPGPRARVFRMIFGLIVLAFLLAIGTARARLPPSAILTATPKTSSGKAAVTIPSAPVLAR